MTASSSPPALSTTTPPLYSCPGRSPAASGSSMRTIRRFTWHDNGAIYGAPDKKLDGSTRLKNLFLCGTDQGYVGIIGSIISGIAMGALKE